MRRPPLWPVQAVRVALGHRPPFALCYHGVGVVADGADPHGLFVSREQFAAHLDVLGGDGYAIVGAAELWRRVCAGVGDRVGAVTFDDALEQTGEVALPLLAERGMGASVFVATGLLGRPHPHVSGERVMSASQVVDMAAAGVEVGAHSVDHPRLRDLSDVELADQLRRSRARLEDLLGRPVTTMAYPFGAHDERVVRAAREAGYDVACACSGTGRWEALRLPREPVFPSTTATRIRLKATGLYGPVHRLAESGLRERVRRLLRRG